MTGELMLVTAYPLRHVRIWKGLVGGGGGIGSAVCAVAAEAGFRVVVADINSEGAKATLASLPHPNDHLALTFDLTSKDSVQELFAQIESHYGQVPTLLAHCAAVNLNYQGIEGCTEEILDLVIAVNYKGTHRVNRAMVQLLRREKLPGAIVNLSSVDANGGYWPSPGYTGTKGAVKAFSKSIAKELGTEGTLIIHWIRVNVVEPGSIDTEFGIRGLSHLPPDERKRKMDELWSMAKIPLGRYGTTTEVANAIMFLLSDKASYITAGVFEVNGGALDQPGIAP